MDILLFWLGIGAAQKGAGFAAELGGVAGHWYSDYGVDNCRSLSSVGEPETLKIFTLWAVVGLNEQIFGANEQVPGRWPSD
jgi:hypothetical protein